MKEIEVHINEWIEKISKLQPELNGFSICPYAKSAKYTIIHCRVEDIIPVADYEVVFYVVENYLDLQTIQYWVKFYNQLYTQYIFLEDHADYDTYINDIQTNNGKYNLILMQDLQKLRNSREILSNTEYYTHWSDDMLREVLANDYEIVKKSG